MKFSLIIGTLNRRESLFLCLDSLFKQTCSDYEIIIIDQSDNDDTCDYIKGLNRQDIVYIKVDYKGLSKARNEALNIARGEYFCLIDDDAYYDSKYLENALLFLGHEKTIVSGFIFDTIKNKPFASYESELNAKSLSIRRVMKTCPSAALIIPMAVVSEIGYFDEKLGIGGEYGAGEETDLLLRAIENGYTVYYYESCKLKHPVPIPKTKQAISVEKRANYYSGMGALFKKHMKNNREMRKCYYEQWLRFILKRMLFFKYRANEVAAHIKGFKRGFDNYFNE